MSGELRVINMATVKPLSPAEYKAFLAGCRSGYKKAASHLKYGGPSVVRETVREIDEGKYYAG